MDLKSYWQRRAGTYDRLSWVHKGDTKDKLVECGDFCKEHVVLDVGTGSGAIALAVAPLVKEVHGIDVSPAMLSLIQLDGMRNIFFQEGDVRNIQFESNRFDRVTARNMFHSIINPEDQIRTVEECYRVLRPGGRFILAEGVPPRDSLKDDFDRIFALKEERATFLPSDLVALFDRASFRKVDVVELIDPRFDVNNWLDNDGTLSPEVKKQIYDLHKYSSEEFKSAYNLREVDGNIFIDIKFVFVIGEK